MIKFSINGKELEVEPGTTIMRAAEKIGIEIPRFCWHPALSIAGNCRMCLVKIEKNPKLQPACNTTAAEGMLVSTDTEEVREAVRGVLEFILINHPLDCPICDQAGECWLQNYYMEYGLYKSKFAERKVKKGKVMDIGRGIKLDQERCILCARCVRFMNEIARSEELAIFKRGNRVELNTFPGKELQSPYSSNIVDICPVGALTSNDFRFKCRAWFLTHTHSICPGCANGCNIFIHHAKYQSQALSAKIYRENLEVARQVIIPHIRETIFRLMPRSNGNGKQAWMCDEGKLTYKHVNSEGRILMPLVREGEKLVSKTWAEAMEALTVRISGALSSSGGKAFGAIGSPWASNEENEALKKFSTLVLGSDRIAAWAGEMVKGYADDFLMKEDRSPNRKGAENVLGKSGWEGAVKESKVLIMIDQDPYSRWKVPPALEEASRKLGLFVVLGTNLTEAAKLAHFVLPIPTFAEQDGTFMNIEGNAQKFQKAFEPLGSALPANEILSRLSRRLGHS